MGQPYQSIIAPSKYFQGKDVLESIFDLTCHLGRNYAFVTDAVVRDIVSEKIEKAFAGKEGKHIYILQRGESTDKEAKRIAKEAMEAGCTVLVGVGGGKVIDSAKLASLEDPSFKVVIVPTSAASDAPCSANAVVYTEEGAFVETRKPKENPSVVLVDTGIIAKAPARLLVAGMGDAFVTYYEARASHKAGLTNLSGGQPTEAAMALSKLCRDLLLKYGAEAKASVEKKEWSEALEKVAEANILLSGIGFESGGLSLSHATYNGLTNSVSPFPVMHGEGVAFGLLLQLTVEYTEAGRWDDEEWKLVTDFYKSVGLPTSFEAIGIEAPSDELLRLISEKFMTSSGNSVREPFTVTAEKIYAALTKLRDMKI